MSAGVHHAIIKTIQLLVYNGLDARFAFSTCNVPLPSGWRNDQGSLWGLQSLFLLVWEFYYCVQNFEVLYCKIDTQDLKWSFPRVASSGRARPYQTVGSGLNVKTSDLLIICFPGGVTIVKLPRCIGSKSRCPGGPRPDLNDLNDEIIAIRSLNLSSILALFHNLASCLYKKAGPIFSLMVFL